MTGEYLRHTEPGVRQEQLVITPESLWEDNHSAVAEARREEFEIARLKGKLIGVDRCSDARVSIVGNSISVGTIAAAGIPSTNLIRDRGLAAWLSLSHFAGDTVELEKMPEDCGGAKAKAQIGSEPRESGIEKYVSEIIKHPDPLIQTILTAEAMAEIGGKPVLAAAQDHLNHAIYPVAFFQMKDGQMTSVSAVRNIDIFNYDERRIYENGIPTITEDVLPEPIAQLLEQNRREQKETMAKYPDLERLQKVQKPRMVLLSTDPRSAKIRYPRLSQVPGSMFKVFVPREKINGALRVHEEDLETSLSQVEYPISHAVDNAGDPEKPFSNTDTLIIETGDMAISRRMAQKTIQEHNWMQNWLQLPERKIILVQTNGGIVYDMDQLAA